MADEREIAASHAAPGGRTARRRRAIALVLGAGALCGGLAGLAHRATAPAKRPRAPRPAIAAPREPGARPATPASDPDDEYRRLVRYGDLCHDEAAERLKQSDPALNPAGWEAENGKALDLLGRALDHYQQALDIRGDSLDLQERVRDTQFKRVLALRRKTGR
jgi:hypothetical protein